MIFKLFLLSTLVGLASSACFDNGDKEIGGSCYKFVAQKLSFEDARNWCHYKNPVTASYLAYVPNQFTSNFLASYARSAFGTNDGSFWIGLSRKSGGSWSWDAGFPLGYTNFGDQVGQNYVAESIVNAKWNTFGASDTNFFVCGYDPAAPPTFAPQTPGTSGPTPTMRATTQPVPTTTESQCLPTGPRTILFAYSTDLNYTIFEQGFNHVLFSLKDQYLWRTYANIRFDTRNEEQIAYHYSFQSFNASVLSHKPDPSLGYQDSTTGSDVLEVIKKFLQTSPSLCGSSIFIVAKRYPNEAPQLEGLISELRNNHIFVYIIADSSPNGGTNSAALFEISSKTNGFCIFGSDTAFDIYISSITFISRPYQVASKNVQVTGSGSQSLSFKVYGSSQAQQLGMIVTLHSQDESVKSLNYTLTDPNGEVNTSGPFTPVKDRVDTLCWEFPVVNNTIEYTLTVNYEYEKDREGYLEMRFYSEDYKIGYWLPFDN